MGSSRGEGEAECDSGGDEGLGPRSPRERSRRKRFAEELVHVFRQLHQVGGHRSVSHVEPRYHAYVPVSVFGWGVLTAAIEPAPGWPVVVWLLSPAHSLAAPPEGCAPTVDYSVVALYAVAPSRTVSLDTKVPICVGPISDCEGALRDTSLSRPTVGKQRHDGPFEPLL